MSNKVYAPGVQNSPYGILAANPQSSNYGTISGLSATETILLKKSIAEIIYDAAPAQFTAMKLAFEMAPQEENNDEFEYLEYTFGRSPITSNGTAIAVAASAGNFVTQTFAVTAGSLTRISTNMVITYPDGTEGVITTISGSNVTVTSLVSVGLSAVASGDVFAIRSTIKGDGMDSFKTYQRTETVTRYNFIQWFFRAQRWGKVEMQKYKNSGTTNYMSIDINEKMKQLRYDMFISYFNGHRGEYKLAGGEAAKSMGGIYPTMVSAGSMSANPTLAGLQSSFESLAFATNYKAENATRFVYATQEMLHEISKIYKQPGLRYTPSDKVAKLSLNQIEFGGMNFVLVPCELFRETSCFPADWANKILVLDTDTMRPVKMKGLPQFDMGMTNNLERGSREDFTDFWVEGQMSLKINNPLASFYIDVQ